MDVTFAKQHIRRPVEFDFSAVFRFKEHSVAVLNRSNVRANSHNFCPDEAFTYLGGSRNDDATGGLSLPVRPLFLHQHSVVQQLDRQLGT